MADSSLPHPLDRPVCVLTIEKPWSGTRRKDDEPRAFWARDIDAAIHALRQMAFAANQGEGRPADPAGCLDMPEESFLQALSDGAERHALALAAFGEQIARSQWRAKGGVHAQMRYPDDLNTFEQEGQGALVIRCLCPDPRDESPFERLLLALGQSRASLVELPCSPTSGSFVGASFELWIRAIEAFHERQRLAEGEPETPPAPARARPRSSL